MITTINKTIHELRDLLDAAACDAKARRIVTIFDECKRRLVIRIEGWVTFVALVLTVIGAAFYLGSTMATEDDVAGLRQEMREMRERSEAQMQELRGHLVDHLDGHAN